MGRHSEVSGALIRVTRLSLLASLSRQGGQETCRLLYSPRIESCVTALNYTKEWWSMLQARITLEELSPQASHADLEARLEGVLRFARGGIDNLERHSPFWGDDTIGFVTQADKIVVETALLALLASRVDQPVIRRGSILLASVLQPFARSERNRVLLLRFPHTAASLGIAHVALSRVGNIDDDFDQLLRRALTTGQVDALERLPYRTMDLGWLRGVLNPDTEPHFDDLLP